MNENYFRRVRNETPTQFFCDGPHMPWLRRAVEWGAVGCTSNPPRVARAVRLDSEYWDPEIDRILAENPGLPDEDLADIVTQRVVRRAGGVLRPVFEETGGERGLPYLIIAAGARGPRHFTELVGGDLFVTLSAQVQEEIADLDPPVISRIDDFPPEEVIQELRQKFPDFRRAYDEDGLEASEMRAFGPAVKIEEYFLEGFDSLIQSIRARKK